TFYVSTWKGTDPVVLTQGITWDNNGSGQAALSSGGTSTVATFTIGTPTGNVPEVPSPAVREQIAGRTVSSTATAAARPPSSLRATSVRATVVDELTGRPVEGARLVLSDTATGAWLTGGTAVTQTDGTATATLSAAPGSGEVSVTIFHDEYTFTTLA